MVIDSVYCDSSVVYIGGRINIPDTAVSVGLYAPDGTPYLLKNIKSDSDGKIELSYFMTDDMPRGTYSVVFKKSGLSVTDSFEYTGRGKEIYSNISGNVVFENSSGNGIDVIPSDGFVNVIYSGARSKSENMILAAAAYDKNGVLIAVKAVSDAENAELEFSASETDRICGFVLKDDLVPLSYAGVLTRNTKILKVLDIDYIKSQGVKLDYDKNYGCNSEYSLKLTKSSGTIELSRYFMNTDTSVQPYKNLSGYNKLIFYAYSDKCTDDSFGIRIDTMGNVYNICSVIKNWTGWRMIEVDLFKDFTSSLDCSPRIADDNYSFTPEYSRLSLTTNGLGESEVYIDNLYLARGDEQWFDRSLVSDAEYENLASRWCESLAGESELDYTEAAKENSLLKKRLDSMVNDASKWDSAEKLFKSKPVNNDNLLAEGDDNLKSIYDDIKKMALGYSVNYKGASKQLYKNPNQLQLIKDCLEYGYNLKPGYGAWLLEEIDGSTKWGNWWNWQIGIPIALVDTLFLIKDDLGEELTKKYLEPVKKIVPETVGTGANRVWTAYVLLGEGILDKDFDRICEAQREAAFEIRFNTCGDGLYEDGSFLQHDGLAYNFGYGINLYRYLTKIITILDNTEFALPTQKVRRFIQSGIDGYMPLVKGGSASSLTRGRSYGTQLTASELTECFIDLRDLSDNEQRKALESFIAANKDKELENRLTFNHVSGYNEINDESAEDKALSKMYYNMERAVFDNEVYRLELALSSDRIKRYESILYENMEGWYTGDGMMYLTVDGLNGIDQNWNRYSDKYKIPGTTESNAERRPETYRSSVTDKLLFAENNLAGGAATDGNGVITMQFGGYKNRTQLANDTKNNPCPPLELIEINLDAKKSWFAFKDKIVCLGADINHHNARRVPYKGINYNISDLKDLQLLENEQRLYSEESFDNECEVLEDNVYTYIENREFNGVLYKDGIAAESYTGISNISTLNLDNRLGYYFPYGADIETDEYTGTANTYASDAQNKKYNYIASQSTYGRYFTAAIAHGGNFKDADYAYVILPEYTSAQTQEYAEKPDVEIICNDNKIQAVRDTKNEVTGIVFHKYGRIGKYQAPGGVAFMADESSGLKISFADASHSLTAETLRIYETDLIAESCDDGIRVVYEKDYTDIKVDFRNSRGKTYNIKFNKR